jgi:lipopolysaccharide export system protein LptA
LRVYKLNSIYRKLSTFFLIAFVFLVLIFSGKISASSQNTGLSDMPSPNSLPPTTPASITPAPMTSPVPVSDAPDEAEKTRVQLSSDHLSGDDNTKDFQLWGNVKIEQEDSVLTSDNATFNSKSKIAVASNNVKFTRPGSILTGDKVTIYYEEKRGIWEGNVHLVQEKTGEKEGEQQEMKDGPVDLYCDTLEFFWEKPRKAIANSNVKVHQKDKHAYGDKGTYTEKPQTILVEGNVRLEKDDGSWMTCDQLTIHVKEETVEADGHVKGSMLVDQNKLE